MSLTCKFCSVGVGSEDGYSSHLKLVHDIKKNIHLILEEAVKNNGAKETAVIEEIVIDDDDDIEDEVNEKVSVSEETFDIKIENQISDFVQDLFKDLNVMINGILPDDLDANDIKEETKETKESKEIAGCFADLRSFVENIEIPSDFTLEEFLTNGSSKTEISVSKKPSTTNKKPPIIEQQIMIPTPKSGQTLLLCPVEKCSFFLTKQEFKDTETAPAAKHLKEKHKIKATDMVGGKLAKWQKIKGERLNKK